jgi:Periplasmic protein involved in polysaccharide export
MTMGNAVYRRVYCRKEAKVESERLVEIGATNSQDPPSHPFPCRPRWERHERTRGAILFFGIARRFVSRVGDAGAALVVLALLSVGCAHEAPFVWVQDVPVGDQTPVARIQARDTISIDIAGQPSLSGESTVRDDGSYFNPLVGSVALAGLTLAEAGATLQARLKAVVVAPVVAVALVRTAPIRVGVMGEVKNPGSYELIRDRRLSAALLAAGGLTDYARDERIFVTRMAGENRRVRVRFRLRDVTTSEPHTASFLLLDGDLVFVE